MGYVILLWHSLSLPYNYVLFFFVFNNSYLALFYVNGSGSIASVGAEKFVCCCLLVIVWFLFGEIFSSSGCLGGDTLFYCGTH